METQDTGERNIDNNIDIKKAAFVTVISKYITVIVQLLFSFVLARIISPEDYGIVAITVVFTNFFAILADMGISNGIIQDKSLTKDEIKGIFMITIMIGFGLMCAFVLFSIPLAAFYNEKVLVNLGVLLSISLLFSTFNMVPNALLLKDKQFKIIARRNVDIPIITGGITLIFALMGWKYYALVLQSVLRNAMLFFSNYYSAKKRYGLGISKEKNYMGLRKIKKFSAFQFGFSIINYFSRNMDNLLIGKFFGTSMLGYYDKAYKLMSYPQGYLTNAITPVMHPILSEYQNNEEIIYEKYIKIIKFLSLIGVFIMPFCFFSSTEIVGILYGREWLMAAPFFSLLALSVWAQMILGTTGSIFQSLGNTKRLFISGIINTTISMIGIVTGICQHSITKLTGNLMIAYNIQFLLSMFILIQMTFHKSYLKFLKKLIPDAIIFFFMMATGQFIKYILNMENMFLILGIRMLGMGLVYIFLLFIMKQNKYIQILAK